MATLFGSQHDDPDKRKLRVIAQTAVVIAFISLSSQVFTYSYYYKKVDTTAIESNISKNEQQVKELRNTITTTGVGSLETGQKLCRVFQGKTWRDGLIVPQNWTISLCRDYQLKTGGTAYQLGCIKTDGTILGGENGSLPSPNCGWQ